MVASFNQIQSAVSNAPVKSIQDLLGSPSPSSGLPSFMNTILPQVSAQSLMSNALANIAAQHQAPTFDPSSFITVQQYLQQHPITNTPSTTKDYIGTAKDSSSDTSDWTKLFTVLNDTFGQIGGLTRTAVDDVANKLGKDWNSNDPWYVKGLNLLKDVDPVSAIADAAGQGITAGAKQQWNDWTDGKWSWGDVPGFGFLDGAANSWTSGEKLNQDIGLNNVLDKYVNNSLLQNGWAGDWNKWLGSKNVPFLSDASKAIMSADPKGHGFIDGLAGLGTEILTDPLTYLTGGAGISTKAGKLAELSKMSELGKSLGLSGKFDNFLDFTNTVSSKLLGEANTEQTAAQLAKAKNIAQTLGVNPNLINDASDVLAHARTTLTAQFPHLPKNAIDTAINQIKQDIDATGLHFKPAAMQKIEDLKDEINAARAEAANKNINSFGLSIPGKNAHVTLGQTPEKLLGLVNNPLYRTEATINSVTKMHLNDVIDNLTSGDKTKALQLENAAKQYYKVNDLSELTKTQYDDLIEKLDKFNYTKGTNNFYKDVADFANSKYTKVNNAKTSFEHLMDGKWNKFNPRSLATTDKFLNSMANHIADGNSAKVGLQAQYGKQMNDIEKFIKKNNISEQDMMDMIYHLEGKAPQSYGASWTASQKVQDLANIVKPVLDDIARREQGANILAGVRPNYFPHVLSNNLSESELQKIQAFNSQNPHLMGQSSANAFNQTRTGFPTFADRQDYLENLATAIKNETDPIKRQNMQEMYDKVQNMFEENVPKAVASRIREGARAQAMKGLQDNLSKYGMFKANIKNPITSKTHGLVQLDASDAKKLGLATKDSQGNPLYHYMQPDVLAGMKRIDDIFTAQGMNKLVRHIDAITNLFRLGVTTFKFSHYRNNIIGNAINNLAAGVSINDYKAAGKLLSAMRSGSLNDYQLKIIESAYKHNVISGGFVSDIFHDGGVHFTDPTKLEKFVKAIGNFKPAKVMRNESEKVDDIFRLGNYINGLKKFGEEGKAATQVRTYLFNYNEMTNADRAIRRVIPFWNWTKNNLPLQVKNLLEKPAIALDLEKARKRVNEGQDGADWQKDTGIKLPFMNYYTSVPTPTDDLKQFLHPTQFAASMNPLLKMGIEMVTNKNLYTNKPISYGSDTVQAKDVPYYLAKNFGVTKDVADAFGMGGKKTLPEIIANYFNPISVINKGAATHQ